MDGRGGNLIVGRRGRVLDHESIWGGRKRLQVFNSRFLVIWYRNNMVYIPPSEKGILIAFRFDLGWGRTWRWWVKDQDGEVRLLQHRMITTSTWIYPAQHPIAVHQHYITIVHRYRIEVDKWNKVWWRACRLIGVEVEWGRGWIFPAVFSDPYVRFLVLNWVKSGYSYAMSGSRGYCSGLCGFGENGEGGRVGVKENGQFGQFCEFFTLGSKQPPRHQYQVFWLGT